MYFLINTIKYSLYKEAARKQIDAIVSKYRADMGIDERQQLDSQLKQLLQSLEGRYPKQKASIQPLIPESFDKYQVNIDYQSISRR